MDLRSLLVGVGVVAALAGCAGQVSCTAAGCVSQVSLDVRGASRLAGGGSVRVCLADSPTCLTQTVASQQQVVYVEIPSGVVPGPGVTADGSVAVSVEVSPTSGAATTVTGQATLTKVAPNGERCGPVCYSTTLALTDQAVRQVDPGTMPTPGEQLPDTRSPSAG